MEIKRSVLCVLFHRSADLLRVLYLRLLELVPQSVYVNADETPLPVQDKDKTRRAYIWTFITESIVTYVYSPSRSGQTPLRILGASEGFL